jgi:hypothetical protein
LEEARKMAMKAKHSIFFRARHARDAVKLQEKARNELVETS